jgi:spore maturation protein CgeB
MQALERLGHKIYPLDTEPSIKPYSLLRRIIFRIARQLGYPIDVFNINKKLIDEVAKISSGVIWLDKALIIKDSTLKYIKTNYRNLKIVGYSPDDMGGKHNQSKYFINGLSSYDLFVTTKSYNVPELKAMGAGKVLFIDNAFDPKIHFPQNLTIEEKISLGGDVGFIGAWEKERAAFILTLAESGIKVRWWGCDKPSLRSLKHQNLVIEKDSLWGSDYAKAICAFKINLCFLRKINRDVQTTRSIEIPACGGFMLAERTDEHLRLFKEGQEADFFSSTDELIKKVNFYLNNYNEIISISNAGRSRCINSGYSNDERLKKIMMEVGNE